MIEPVRGIEPQRARCITANNGGLLTLRGTNTWVLAEPDASRCVLVDPGPDSQEHIENVLRLLDTWALEVGLIVLTHRHADHSGALPQIADRTEAPVRALDPAFCRLALPFADGERVELDGLVFDVLATPGHTDDSLCLHLLRDGALVTGDTVLGKGPSLIAWPDGKLAPYLASLGRIHDLAAAGLALTLLPGHGPLVLWGLEAIKNLIAHRTQRLEQVQTVLASGVRTSAEVVQAVYGDPEPALREVVVAQVHAQLEYLASRGVPRAAEALNN